MPQQPMQYANMSQQVREILQLCVLPAAARSVSSHRSISNASAPRLLEPQAMHMTTVAPQPFYYAAHPGNVLAPPVSMVTQPTNSAYMQAAPPSHAPTMMPGMPYPQSGMMSMTTAYTPMAPAPPAVAPVATSLPPQPPPVMSLPSNPPPKPTPHQPVLKEKLIASFLPSPMLTAIR